MELWTSTGVLCGDLTFGLGDPGWTFGLRDLGRLEWWSSTDVLVGDLTFGLGDRGLE